MLENFLVVATRAKIRMTRIEIVIGRGFGLYMGGHGVEKKKSLEKTN